MKKLILKFTVGFLALAIGITIVWATGIFQVLFPQPANSSLPVAETSVIQQPVREKSGKVLLQFKRFAEEKGWVADFEIINDTEKPILYLGGRQKDKDGYCVLGVKRQEQYERMGFDVRSSCYHSTGKFLHTLKPGESVVLGVRGHEVRQMFNEKYTEESRAQIGFEVFVGEEKHRQVLWSEEITFPIDR